MGRKAIAEVAKPDVIVTDMVMMPARLAASLRPAVMRKG